MAEKICTLKKSGSSGGTLSELLVGVNVYNANQAYLMIPKSLLSMYKTIQLLSTTVGTDYSNISDSSLITSMPIQNESGTQLTTLTTTPINISSLSFDRYILFKNVNNYQFLNYIVKLSN